MPFLAQKPMPMRGELLSMISSAVVPPWKTRRLGFSGVGAGWLWWRNPSHWDDCCGLKWYSSSKATPSATHLMRCSKGLRPNPILVQISDEFLCFYRRWSCCFLGTTCFRSEITWWSQVLNIPIQTHTFTSLDLRTCSIRDDFRREQTQHSQAFFFWPCRCWPVLHLVWKVIELRKVGHFIDRSVPGARCKNLGGWYTSVPAWADRGGWSWRKELHENLNSSMFVADLGNVGAK